MPRGATATMLIAVVIVVFGAHYYVLKNEFVSPELLITSREGND